jgi:AcrR family transcriptional regulator
MRVSEPQQARAVRTREAIVDGAARVIADKGYDASSINDITTASNVKKGALYHHFPTKHALAEAVMAEGLVLDELDPQQEPRMQIVVDASIRLAWLTPRVPAVRAAARLATDPGTAFYRKLWDYYIPWVREILEQSYNRGELLPQIEPAAMARVWVAAFTGFDIIHRLDPENLPRDIADINRTVARMCVTPETLRELDLSEARGEVLGAGHPRLVVAQTMANESG